MAVTSSDVLSDYQVSVLNGASNAFAQPINLPGKLQAVQTDVVALNADVAALQQSWPEAVVRSYQGSRTIAEINALTPAAGDAYVAASAGTPTAGTSDALTIGDITEYDGTQWKKMLDSNANSFPPADTVVIVGNGTLVSPLAEGTDENKLATFDGTSLTPTLVAPSDGDIRSITSTSIYAGRVFMYDTSTLWTQTTAPLSSATPGNVAAAGAAGTSTSASRSDHVHAHSDLSATTSTLHAGLSVAYTVTDGNKNKIPDAADDVQTALTGLDAAMPFDVFTPVAAAGDRITNTAVGTAFATTITTAVGYFAAGTEATIEFEILAVQGNAADTLALELQIDGGAIVTVAAFDVTDVGGDVAALSCQIRCGAAGASGSVAINAKSVRTLAAGTTVVVERAYINDTFDTTATHVFRVLATWSGASTDNKADLRQAFITKRLAAAVT